MTDSESSKFNNILKEIIEKSLFTERQIEIILNYKNLLDSEFPITRGAYYRQLSQSRHKLTSFYYTTVLLRALGILLPDDIDVITEMTEHVTDVIRDRDISPEKEREVTNLIDLIVKRTTNL